MSDAPTSVNGISADRLRSIVERAEALNQEVKERQSDVRDLFKEASSAGFDVKALRQIIKIRSMEPGDVEEQEMLLDTYRRALGL